MKCFLWLLNLNNFSVWKPPQICSDFGGTWFFLIVWLNIKTFENKCRHFKVKTNALISYLQSLRDSCNLRSAPSVFQPSRTILHFSWNRSCHFLLLRACSLTEKAGLRFKGSEGSITKVKAVERFYLQCFLQIHQRLSDFYMSETALKHRGIITLSNGSDYLMNYLQYVGGQALFLL